MRVKITYTVEVPDRIRRAINDYYGKPGLASRDEVRSWYEMYGKSMDDELMSNASSIEDERKIKSKEDKVKRLTGNWDRDALEYTIKYGAIELGLGNSIIGRELLLSPERIRQLRIIYGLPSTKETRKCKSKKEKIRVLRPCVNECGKMTRIGPECSRCRYSRRYKESERYRETHKSR